MIYPNDSKEGLLALERQRTLCYEEEMSEILFYCTCCGKEIYEDEEFLETSEGTYCKNCVIDMTSEDVLEILGVRFQTKERR